MLCETRVRGTSLSSTVAKIEKWDWRGNSLEFLRAALLEGYDQPAKQCPGAKLKRLASLCNLHAEDWRMQCSGVFGYKQFFPVPDLSAIGTRSSLI